MTEQIKSKKRVANHGEVFTAEREVNAMLDLVREETERIDSRFLEPACGDGNFLAEILIRKLKVVKERYKKSASDYEKYSVLAITSIYGVDLLQDNVQDCRKRLYKIWLKEYTSNCKDEVNNDCCKAVEYILCHNIVCGNALSLMKVDAQCYDTEEPIIFPEWAFVSSHFIKRADFRFDVLLKENPDEGQYSMQFSIFSDDVDSHEHWMIDPITNEKVPKAVREYKPIYYRRVWEYER